MANLVLLCHRHHWLAHEGGWQLVRADGEAVRAIPPLPGDLARARAPDGAIGIAVGVSGTPAARVATSS
jgi:hypothetical protein